MKPPIRMAALLVAFTACCAGCTTLGLLPSQELALNPDKRATWLIGEWQASGAKHDPAKRPREEADWIVSAGEQGLLHFDHGKLHFEVEAVSLADERHAAILEVTHVGDDGTRRKDSMWYVARWNDQVLSIQPIGRDSLELDKKAEIECGGFDAFECVAANCAN